MHGSDKASDFLTSPSEHWQRLKWDGTYALRMMKTNWAFTLLAVVTLALGVGANTAIFSVVHALILRSLPYKDSARIVIVRQQFSKVNVADRLFSVPEIKDYRDQNHTLEDMAEVTSMQYILLGRETSERVQTGVVSANYFDLFGIKPIMGRGFLASDDEHGAPPVMLLSYEYWQKSQHGDSSIVGKTFTMNDKVHTVIGVLPPVPQYPRENDVYITTAADPLRSSNMAISTRGHHMMRVFARLKPGVSLAEANSDLAVIASRLEREHPQSYPSQVGYHTLALSLQEQLTRTARPTLWVLSIAALLVLLISCANVANFMLARLSKRGMELTVRSALGASKARLFQQLFTESALLGLVAAALGVLFAFASNKLLVQFVARLSPRASEITIDGPVLLFAVASAVLVSFIAGSSQAFFSKSAIEAGLKEETRGATVGKKGGYVRNSLIVAQVAFSFALLIPAGLMLRSLMKLQNVDPGLTTDRVLTMALSMGGARYATDAQILNASHKILQKVEVLPGVESVAISSNFPFNPDAIAKGPTAYDNRYEIEGKSVSESELPPAGSSRWVTPDYFKTLGIPLIHGRTFLPTDKADTPVVAVINQAFADHRFAGEDPIGKRISRYQTNDWMTIIGVVGNTKEFGLAEDTADEIYFAMDQDTRVASLLVRTPGDPMTLANSVRGAVREFDPETAVANVETLEMARKDTLAPPRVLTSLLSLFAGLALVVALSGIGGILALSVSQRVKEIGIRIALGAQPSDILGVIMKEGMTLVAVGLVFGLAVAFAMSNSLRAFLFHITPADPLTLAGVAALLAIAASIACYIPALRATKIAPSIALRHQ